MSEHIVHVEWRRQNDATKYPFAERALLANEAGRMVPEGTFLDAVIHPVGGKVGLYLTKAVITHQEITLYIGNQDQKELCSGVLDASELADTITLVDIYGRPAGLLVSEAARLAVLLAWGVGTHEFEPNETEFAATVCIPTPEIGVRGIRLPDGSVLVGDVWLVGDDGVVLRTEEGYAPAACGEPVRNYQSIRMDVVGDPLFRRRLCSAAELFTTPRFIKTIRVVSGGRTFDCSPDTIGNMQILVNNAEASDTVLRLVNGPDGLTFNAVGQKI